MVAFIYAAVVQLIERFLAKEEVAGLSPVCRSRSNAHPGVFSCYNISKYGGDIKPLINQTYVSILGSFD